MTALFTLEQNDQSEVTLFSGGSTGSLASGSSALSAAVNNVAGGTSGLGGYSRGKFRFSGTFGSAPTTPASIDLYAVRGDSTGSTYETSSVTPPPNLPLCSIPVDGTNTSQVRDSFDVGLPAGYWKIMCVNNGSGQTISSGWSLTIETVTDQGY